MDEINWPNDFYSDMFSLDFDSLFLYNILTLSKVSFSWFCIDKKLICPYIEVLIPEFLAFCYWHN